MSKKNKFLIFIFILLMIILPYLTFAAGLVDCDNSVAKPCDFNALMGLVNKVVNFILVGLAVPIAAVMFAYAGIQMIISGGESSGARETAKNVFTNTVIGLAAVAGSWIIIHTLFIILGYNASWIGF